MTARAPDWGPRPFMGDPDEMNRRRRDLTRKRRSRARSNRRRSNRLESRR